ncbi:MAG: hypothetical protein M3310_07820, partial [Actinomycetota bacterium]|nr:hypothetical protein [Actinomycetota bacterium]
ARASARQRVRLVLTSGETVVSSLDGDEESARRELDAVIASLGTARFVRIGDDTIVRSDEVRLIQIREEDSDDEGGFLEDLKSKITGGEPMSTTYDPDQQTTQTAYRTSGESQGRQQSWADQPWLGYGRRPWSETKPFFMTSEFLAFVLGAVGVLLAAVIADNFDAPRAWLYVSIIVAAYIVSRGLAKAGTRDPNPDRSRGYGG